MSMARFQVNTVQNYSVDDCEHFAPCAREIARRISNEISRRTRPTQPPRNATIVSVQRQLPQSDITDPLKSPPNMEKVAKRAAQAQKQAFRRAQLQAHREGAEHRARNRGMLKQATAEIKQNVRDAKAMRREAWQLGPLAPKRDLGFNHFGAFQEHPRLDPSLEGRQRFDPEILKKRCAWAGTPNQLNIVPGDRVVIVNGHDKGKIDRIKSINRNDMTIKLEEHHKVCSLFERRMNWANVN